jgi:hypothetical protein
MIARQINGGSGAKPPILLTELKKGDVTKKRTTAITGRGKGVQRHEAT